MFGCSEVKNRKGMRGDFGHPADCDLGQQGRNEAEAEVGMYREDLSKVHHTLMF